jgi:hypothetical protein
MTSDGATIDILLKIINTLIYHVNYNNISWNLMELRMNVECLLLLQEVMLKHQTFFKINRKSKTYLQEENLKNEAEILSTPLFSYWWVQWYGGSVDHQTLAAVSPGKGSVRLVLDPTTPFGAPGCGSLHMCACNVVPYIWKVPQPFAFDLKIKIKYSFILI